MPQISRAEFERVPLRAHAFMQGIPLHDVWAVDLGRTREPITLAEFLRQSRGAIATRSPAASALLRLRFFIGRIAGWDREPAGGTVETFAGRLTSEDRARTLVAPGTPDGHFRILYRFENEQLTEIANRTVHAAALSALVETEHGYRFYFAVYVRSVGPMTPVYMALIDPFRKLIVYPSLLRNVRASWEKCSSDSISTER
jgi:Protein of unknown function (DUF2867)